MSKAYPLISYNVICIVIEKTLKDPVQMVHSPIWVNASCDFTGRRPHLKPISRLHVELLTLSPFHKFCCHRISMKFAPFQENTPRRSLI